MEVGPEDLRTGPPPSEWLESNSKDAEAYLGSLSVFPVLVATFLAGRWYERQLIAEGYRADLTGDACFELGRRAMITGEPWRMCDAGLETFVLLRDRGEVPELLEGYR